MSQSSSNAANQDQGIDGDGSYQQNISMDVKRHIEKYGLDEIEEYFNRKLNEWKDVEINIGVTGAAGTGKSSFINAIRGMEDEEAPGFAMTGVTETTMEATAYYHPENEKIRFWDLPGIGTPGPGPGDESSLIKSYIEKVKFERYDTFLIFAIKRFTNYDKELAKKVKSLNKSFLFIRTHIDVDVANERKKNENKNKKKEEKEKKKFDEEKMMSDIRENCFQHLDGLIRCKEEVFLISNNDINKWDFDRLAQAILTNLPDNQKECLALSLSLPTREFFKKKAEVLRGRLLLVAGISGACALLSPVPGPSVAVEAALIMRELRFYRSQFGLPEEDSAEFREMNPELKGKLVKYFISSVTEAAKLLAAYATSSLVGESVRLLVPFVGSVIASSISFSSTYFLLRRCVNEMEEIALKYVDRRLKTE